MEEHAFTDALQVADALIVATALETGWPLLTGNDKHYKRLPVLT
jgi:predicted nucleic acid-binding protein